ncbi:MAG: UDP-N-acetylmuramate--L-alanine ligase [Rhodospirillaceae bacterium]
MKNLSRNIGLIHFCGIGGIGMSGIAEILFNLGYDVQGSDLVRNGNVKRLQAIGIPIYIGQSENNLNNASVIVISSAVNAENPELVAARKMMIPVVRRSEMLAELMRLKSSIAIAGTHGKTTTTSLIASILDRGEFDPTVVNGGIINAYGTNAKLGNGDWIVVEADESDGSFRKLPASIALVTNIDPEHLDHWGSFDELRKAFVTFIQNIPFYGLGVLCVDSPEVQTLIARVSDRRIITYGFSPQADYRVINYISKNGASYFDVICSDRSLRAGATVTQIKFPMVGRHNVQNAVGAISVAMELGIDEEKIRLGIETFRGVKRRFTVTGCIDGITIIDDYGHHPVEIEAVLDAARSISNGKVIAVFQPHRYTRVRDLFEDFCTCFNHADAVIVGEIYAAGESPIDGIDQRSLVDGLISRGHRNVRSLSRTDLLPEIVNTHASNGDFVICLGAGDITDWAYDLPDQLARLRSKNAEHR